MKKPVIFIDFGGVYFRSSYPIIQKKFAKKFRIPYKKLLNVYMFNWISHATGKMSAKTYWEYISNKLNLTEIQTNRFKKANFHYSIPNPGMLRLIRKLKKKYTVAALSSIIVGWVEFLEKKYKISNHFHENHYSYDHRVDKPSEKFFLSAAKKMKTKPEDCIVVDDLKPFLAAVRKTGARTILFKNAKQLQRDLKKMGVDV